MTRKDYVRIAAALGRILRYIIHDDSRTNANADLQLAAMTAFWLVVQELTDALKADNPAFDREKFKEAIKAGYKASISGH